MPAGQTLGRGGLLAAGTAFGVICLALLAMALAALGGTPGTNPAGACALDAIAGPGRGRLVGATTFGGPADPSTPGTTGAYGQLSGAMAFAELSPGGTGVDGALGRLPPHTKLRITANGRSVIAEKLDVGRGGGPVGSPPRARVIDLWWETAQALGLPAAWAGPVRIAPVTASDLSLAQPTCNAQEGAGGGEAVAAGDVLVAAGANVPGKPITAATLAFLQRVAGAYGGRLVVTTGTNHSKYTTTGRVSDHWSGHAADIGMTANGGANDSPVGDRIMAACLVVAGLPPALAANRARAGGLYSLVRVGYRVQCIWKTYVGGNHHDHVHIGAVPLG